MYIKTLKKGLKDIQMETLMQGALGLPSSGKGGLLALYARLCSSQFYVNLARL